MRDVTLRSWGVEDGVCGAGKPGCCIIGGCFITIDHWWLFDHIPIKFCWFNCQLKESDSIVDFMCVPKVYDDPEDTPAQERIPKRTQTPSFKSYQIFRFLASRFGLAWQLFEIITTFWGTISEMLFWQFSVRINTSRNEDNDAEPCLSVSGQKIDRKRTRSRRLPRTWFTFVNIVY